MENYKEKLTRAMEFLSKDSRVLFIGQTARYPGSSIYGTLEKIAEEKRIEMPIMEDTQMGISIGLSLQGFIPISIFPRFDFLICATNQLVNHLDKIDQMTNGRYKPKVIVRTAVGSTNPLYPGIQHCSDYTDAFKVMLKNTNVLRLEDKSQIMPAYEEALRSDKSSLIIELSDLYAS